MALEILEKGTPLNISDKEPGIKNLYIGLGWDPADTGKDFDLDSTVVFCGEDGKAKDLNYYSELETKSSTGDVYAKHSKDDLTGSSSAGGDDEFITVKLDKVPTEIKKAYVMVNIYQGSTRNQDFGQVSNSFMRLVNGDTESEIARYDLKAEYAGHTGVMIAELYKMGDEWKVKVIAEAVDGSINDILSAKGLK